MIREGKQVSGKLRVKVKYDQLELETDETHNRVSHMIGLEQQTSEWPVSFVKSHAQRGALLLWSGKS